MVEPLNRPKAAPPEPYYGDWKETVRDIFDMMHFAKEGNVFTGSRIARKVLDLIEKNHRAYFVVGHPPPDGSPEEDAHG